VELGALAAVCWRRYAAECSVAREMW